MRCGLFLTLVATVALANDRECLTVRPLMLTGHPSDATHRIFVKGQVVTTLRFEKPVEPSKTKMLGWEGRFEPLAVVRNKVILEPIQDLGLDEGIPLVVALADGTEIPFLLRPPGVQGQPWADQQVDVFKDRESYAAMHAALMQALKKNDALTEENERYRREETSEDHSLAALLASGGIGQTSFKVANRLSGKDADAEMDATVFQGKGKVAVVFKVKNLDPEQHWSLQRVRLATKDTGRERPVAVRASAREVTPGGSGVIALVVDASAFIDEGTLTSLWLEVYRHDGVRMAYFQLDPALMGR